MSRTFARSSIDTFAFQVGTAVTELLGLLFVTHHVTPSTLGTYVKFVAIGIFTSSLIDFGMRYAAIKRISEGTDPGAYLSASVVWRLALFVVLSVVFLLNAGRIDAYVGASLTHLLVAALLVNLLAESVVVGLMGESRVAAATGLVFGTSVSKIGVWLLALPAGYGVTGLVGGYVVGHALATVVGIVLVGTSLQRPAVAHFRSLFRFSRYSWLSSFEGATWMWMDTLVLGIFVQAAFVGIYEISWKISGVFFFAASAISGVLFPRISDAASGGDLDRALDLLHESLRYTGFIAIPGVVGGLVVGTPVLRAYGPEYVAGYFALIALIAARVAHSYEILFTKSMNGLDRPDLAFRVNFAFVVTNLVGNVLFISAFGWEGAAVATALSMLVKLGLSYSMLNRVVDVTVPWKAIGVQTAAALSMGVVLVPLRLLFRPLSVTELIGVIGVGMIAYLTVVVVLGAELRRDITSAVSALMS